MGRTDEKLKAAVYTRISNDPEGRALGVERQEQDCLNLAKKHGFDVVEVYTDNDISASRSSKKRRPGFEAMLDAAAAGQFDAVLFYTTSRLTRRPAEYERLIPLPVRWMSVRSGEVDLSTADGRLMAGVLAQFDAAESDRIAERVSRAAQQRAAKGQFHGGRPAFGYQLIKNPAGRVVAWEEHHEHAAWLREATDRVLSGESLYSITKSWNELGRTSSNGARWQRRTLGRMLTAPAVAGLRETSDGELVRAQWKPILTRRTWDRLNSLINDPSRSKPFAPGHTTARKYPLSGLLV